MVPITDSPPPIPPPRSRKLRLRTIPPCILNPHPTLTDPTVSTGHTSPSLVIEYMLFSLVWFINDHQQAREPTFRQTHMIKHEIVVIVVVDIDWGFRAHRLLRSFCARNLALLVSCCTSAHPPPLQGRMPGIAATAGFGRGR